MLGKVGRKNSGKVKHPTPTRRPKRTHHEEKPDRKKIEVAFPEEQVSISMANSLISQEAAERKARLGVRAMEKPSAGVQEPKTPKDFTQYEKQMQKNLEFTQRIQKMYSPSNSAKEPPIMSFEAFKKLANKQHYFQLIKRFYGKDSPIIDQILVLIHLMALDVTMETFLTNPSVMNALMKYIYHHVTPPRSNLEEVAGIMHAINRFINCNGDFLLNFAERTEKFDPLGEGFSKVLAAQKSGIPVFTASDVATLNDYLKKDWDAGKELLSFLDKQSRIKVNQDGGKYLHWNQAQEQVGWDAHIWQTAAHNCGKYGSPAPSLMQKIIGDLKDMFNSLFGRGSSEDKSRG